MWCDSIKIYYEYEPVTGVSLDKSSIQLSAGNNATLAATVAPNNASNKNVTWSSTDSNVATVSNGTVTAVGSGEATITVTTKDGSFTATCTVTVATDKSKLASSINAATEYLEQNINDNEDYSAVRTALSSAITAARGVYENADANQTAVDNAVSALSSALQAANDTDLPGATAVTADDKTRVDAAYAAYEALSDDKSNVPEALRNKLSACKAAIDALDFAAYKEEKKAANYEQEGDSEDIKALISAAKKAIDELEFDKGKTLDKNKEAVDGIVNKLLADIGDMRAVDAVNAKINALPAADKVSTKDAADIQAARDAFEALTDDQKKMVSDDVLKKLTDAEDALIVADVVYVIDKLPDAKNVKSTDRADIEEARYDYDALSDAQKKKVPADKLKKLTEAEEALAAADVVAMIEALPKANSIRVGDRDDIEAAREAYEALTDAQKKYVPADLLKKLEDAENAVEASNFEFLANLLPKADDVDIDDEDSIEAARETYEALTDAQKAMVDEDMLKKLTDAEDAFAILNANDKLDALPDSDNVTVDDGDAIKAAREAYDALTDEQKKEISKDKLQKLEDAEDKLVILDALSEVEAKTDKDAIYTGKSKELVNKPATALPKGYTMEYAVTTSDKEPTSGWSTKTPSAKDVGDYYVWCRVVKDGTDEVVASKDIAASIKAKPSDGTVTSGGIYCASNYPSIQAGVNITKSNENDVVEYRWVACDKNDPEHWFEVSPWTKNNNWMDWTPEKSGEYVIVCYSRVVGNEEESEIQTAFGTDFRKGIKGICQMPYSGEGGGYLIGIESFTNPNNSYQYEMLILDCNLLLQNKDPWVYTTGKCGSLENCLWTVWQPKYGYYWTLFRLYDADGNMIDELCYGFENVY